MQSRSNKIVFKLTLVLFSTPQNSCKCLRSQDTIAPSLQKGLIWFFKYIVKCPFVCFLRVDKCIFGMFENHSYLWSPCCLNSPTSFYNLSKKHKQPIHVSPVLTCMLRALHCSEMRCYFCADSWRVSITRLWDQLN